MAVVILNYNSEKDLQICAEQVAQQTGIQLSIILVDNASKPDSLISIKSWLSNWRPDAIIWTPEKVHSQISNNPEIVRRENTVFLIENSENLGYSAGNNIGIHLADILGADVVLIANPDMRIEDPNYLKELSQQLMTKTEYFIAASRILGLDGKDQNPLREARFIEELLWPRFIFRRFFRQMNYVLPLPYEKPLIVPKVSGCCMLLRMEFLRKTGYFDESVFLYCEEPILAARVRKAGGNILFVPNIKAIHAHVASEKENSAKRMLLFIKSRKYYLKTYSGYKPWQLALLFASYLLLMFYNRIKNLSNSLQPSSDPKGKNHA